MMMKNFDYFKPQILKRINPFYDFILNKNPDNIV